MMLKRLILLTRLVEVCSSLFYYEIRFFFLGKIMSGIFEGLNGNFVLRNVKWVGILLVQLVFLVLISP